MPRGKKRTPPEVSSGSMADIAFLLLIFFLVTTTIANDKGITLLLPPPPDEEQEIDLKLQERNIFNIRANSQDKMLVENEPFTGTMEDLTRQIKEFILNFGNPEAEGIEVYNSLPPSMKQFVNTYGRNPDSSDDPTSGNCVVSFKAQRGTSYELYIQILDAVNRAYNEVYAERVGITVDEWLTLDKDDDIQNDMYMRSRQGIPRAISIADPD